MYIYQVAETSAGYHWDAVPLQSGDVGLVKQRPCQRGQEKYLLRTMQSCLFDVGGATLKTPETDQRFMDALSAALAELDAIDHSLTPLKR